ncbi:MAG: hypothetical protein M3173_08310 [Chloroflexota bacterium]|nr:hypothetical protein [Chloroflexota bacterium]
MSSTPRLDFARFVFQRAGASSLIGGVGRDAEIVVNHLATSVRLPLPLVHGIDHIMIAPMPVTLSGCDSSQNA